MSIAHLIGGAVAGLAAVAYNLVLVRMLAAADRLSRLPVELRAGLIGGCIGILAWRRCARDCGRQMHD